MAGKGRHIIVIGASAGGLEALDAVLGSLPRALPASIFIVHHLAPEQTGAALVDRLGQHTALPCTLARHGAAFTPETIYIVPGDHHLLVKKTTMLVTKGARENRYRPGIDPLFRSAAVAHGPRVIGVILTGRLDDGTAGLRAIQQCGGLTVVQDPQESPYPEMPQSALNTMQVDHCVPVAAMGVLLATLLRQPLGKRHPIPHVIRTEAAIAERVVSDVGQVNGLGSQVPYNCPNCGGVLWEMDQPDLQRFRCHTGHSFTAAALLTSQSEKIEETMWIALRMFEERKNLLKKMGQRESSPHVKTSYAQRAQETDVHIERIRAMLLASEGPE